MRIFETLELINTGIGIGVNALLLLLITRFSSPTIGGYKYLLAIFSIFGIYLCKTIVVNEMFGMAMYSRLQSPFASALYLISFAIPFALLDIHFLYRYWTVRGSPRIELFSKTHFILGLVSHVSIQSIIAMVAIVGIVVDNSDSGLQPVLTAFQAKCNDTIEEGWMLMDYVRDGHLNERVIRVLVMALSISSINFTIAIALAVKSFAFLKKAMGLSPTLDDLQLRFLLAACIQTFVPLFLVCLPYSVLLFLTPLGISVGALPDVFPVLVTMFPASDALVVIVLIKDYRDGLLTMIGLRAHNKIHNGVCVIRSL